MFPAICSLLRSKHILLLALASEHSSLDQFERIGNLKFLESSFDLALALLLIDSKEFLFEPDSFEGVGLLILLVILDRGLPFVGEAEFKLSRGDWERFTQFDPVITAKVSLKSHKRIHIILLTQLVVY